jgi:hypothetical protein
MYREGKERAFWVLETSSRWIQDGSSFPSPEDQLAYARGYFDTEGGVPHSPAARFYVQLVQKNVRDLGRLRTLLERLGILCGKLHNPSATVDSDMWRFYVLASSHRAFVERVGSWHPRKRRRMEEWLSKQPARMKI